MCFRFLGYRLRGLEDKSRAQTAAHAEELKKKDADIAKLRSSLGHAPVSGSDIPAAEDKTAEVQYVVGGHDYYPTSSRNIIDMRLD